MEVDIAVHWDTELLARQRAICSQFGAEFTPCAADMRVGLAPTVTNATRQLNGVRLDPVGDACGWYIWGGDEWSEPPDFYIPLRAQSVQTWAPLALPFLGLPPGWRFLLREDRIDVWKDQSYRHADSSN